MKPSNSNNNNDNDQVVCIEIRIFIMNKMAQIGLCKSAHRHTHSPKQFDIIFVLFCGKWNETKHSDCDSDETNRFVIY